ncbi:52 kDa repressor of the inhibitor of the protein kinase-like [Eleginops maclovinus]|uniref:52 kDa repressor of the inhibitor of the protein kinase-like n=1 Tax=Eleginops maclovinus TaxID=56733 RepID=UPI0030807EDF
MSFFCCIYLVSQHVEGELPAASSSSNETALPGNSAVEEQRDAAAPEVAEDVRVRQAAECEVAQPSSVLDSDLGFFIDATKSIEEIAQAVCQMSDGQKYNLVKNHVRPSKHFIFPTTFIGGCNRAFRYDWFEEHGWWLVYSMKLDGAFCICCALFLNATERKQSTSLINAPFSKWHKKTKIIGSHQSKANHLVAFERAKLFRQSHENPNTRISVRMDSAKETNIKENRHILKCVAEAVLYCGRQCIALRGSAEQQHCSGNPGNFLALLKLLSNHDEKLKQHLEKPKLKNATYLSPQSQNEMIDVIGKHMIQAKIVEEVRHAQMYTVLADEVTSHNEELMPMCVRFVDKDLNIREELLEICTLPRITGRHIASAIKDVLSHLSIEIADCRGQGYDGASNMSSENVGVQALIKKDAPKAVYMHCNGHCLNLVIARSCALPVVRNMIDKMKYIVMFFTCSPKREHLLKEVVDKEAHSTGKRKPLIDLSRTRWAARHDAYSHFYSAFVASRLMGLIPSVQCNSDVTVDISEAVALYQDDLPSPEVIDQELKRWKLKWQVKALHQRPSSCASAIKECDEMMYPNIFKLLKIACTLPVTSCECERSASVLRRLNTFMRSSMGEDRMSSLALIHTHYDMALDLDEAVDLYSKMHPRRLELMSVLMQ